MIVLILHLKISIIHTAMELRLVASLSNDGSRRNEEIDDALEVRHSVGGDGSDFLLEDECLVSGEFVAENDTLAGGEVVD